MTITLSLIDAVCRKGHRDVGHGKRPPACAICGAQCNQSHATVNTAQRERYEEKPYPLCGECCRMLEERALAMWSQVTLADIESTICWPRSEAELLAEKMELVEQERMEREAAEAER